MLNKKSMKYMDNSPKNKILKELSTIGISDVFGMGISAIFWFFIASQVEVEEYGEIHYFIAIASFAFIVSLIGTQNAITVFTAKKIKIQSTLFILSLLFGTIAAITVFIFLGRLDAGILVISFIINDLAIAFLIGQKKFSTYGKSIAIQKIVAVGLGLIFYHLFGIEGIIAALAISYVHFSIFIYKEIRNSKFEFSLIKSNSNFILNNWGLNLLGVSRHHLDKIILVPFLGLTVMGNYALALQFWAVLVVFSGIFFKYILTYDSTGIANKKLKIIAILCSIGLAISGIIIPPIIVPIFFEKFTESIIAIQIISLGIIPQVIDKIYLSKSLSQQKSRMVLVSRAVSAVTLILGILLIGQMYGVAGIAISFVLSLVFQTVVMGIANMRKIG
jgi:O-antigen/teichoic acid export membrane protein